MDLNEKLKQLQNVRREGADKVFTMYLNTDPTDPDQQGGEWKIEYKNGIRNFEQYLKEDENKEELKNFQLIKQKVDKFVKGNELQLLKGIIIFATADEEIWFANKVQMHVETEFYWQETPEVNQLARLADRFPKSGIILVQQNEIKVIESYLNEIEDTAYFELDIKTDNWHKKQGPRKATSSMGPGAANMQRDNFDARFAANQQRWYKNIAPKLDKRAKDHRWEKVYIVGEPDSSNELKEQMNKPVDDVIQKNMLDHEESKILQEVFG